MGEKEGAKRNGEKKPAAAAAAAALKMDGHRDARAKEVNKLVATFSGFGDVNIVFDGSKLTVTGKAAPVKLRQRPEDRTHMRVELDSPQPKKDGGAAGYKKPEEDKKKAAEDKKPVKTTVVLKIRLDCEGCMEKVRNVVRKTHGVDSIGMDASKDLVTVKGTMDVKRLVSDLKKKLERDVEVVPAKKDDAGKYKSGGGGRDKKAKDAAVAEKKGDGAGRDKKAKDAAAAKKKSDGAGRDKKAEDAAAAKKKADGAGKA